MKLSLRGITRAQVLAVCAVIAFAVAALPAWAERAALISKHVPAAVANGQLQRVGSMDPAQQMDIVLALPTRNQADLKSLLKDLQDPTSLRYHQYLTPAQYTAHYAATEADYAKVVEFAKQNGFTGIETTSNRHLVIMKSTVANVERVFNVKMGLYQHPTEDRTFFSADREPTVDLDVPLVEVAGLNNMVRPHNRLKHLPQSAETEASPNSKCPGGCSGPSNQYLPSDMRAAYYGGTALTGAGINVAVLGYGSIKASDLTLFTTKTGESLPVPITYPTFSQSTTACEGGGSSGTGCDDGEQTLDVEQVNGMAPGANHIYFYAAEYNSNTSDLPMINAIANDNLGQIVTCSWGWTPTNQVSEDDSFQQMQAQGQTFLNASGDSGSYTKSNLEYPSTDAYITEVGATDLTTNGAAGSWKSETAWADSSGGYAPAGFTGFTTYAIPAWQQLTGVINSSNAGSTTERNDPDVAAEGNFDNYVCDNGSCSTGYGGTSFAAPRWAGFLALVEQQSIANGNGQLGFFPPLLYRIGISSAYGNNLHDITSGSNGKFTAVTGYDLVTGWGSPDGATLINSLAAPVYAISPASGSTATSFSTTITYPDISGTATFYAKVGTSGTPVSTGTCTLTTGATSTTCSNSFTGSALGVGTYNGYVSYVESATYNGTTRSVTKTSNLESFTIADNVSVSASASPSNITTAQSSTVTVTVADSSNSAITLTGSVSFAAGATSLGSCTLSAGTCSVVVAGSTLGVGSYSIVPTYTPAAGYTVTSTTDASLTVMSVMSTASFGTMSFSPAASEPQGASQAITISDTLTFNGAAPSGAVTYVLNGVTYTASCGATSPATCTATVPAATIAALAANTYTVTAALAAGGGYSATIGASGAFTVTTVSSGGGITFSSVSHNFGQVAVGTAATAYTLKVTNTSTTTAYPFSLNFTAANGFTTANNCGASIAAGANCELAFYFTPAAVGVVSTTWSLASESGFTYSPSNGGTLTGSGTNNGGVSLTTAGHNFGTVAVGTNSPTYGTELSNSTTSTENITLGPVPSGPFTMLTNCGTTLAAGSSCEIEFTFKPTSTSPVSVVVPLSGTPTAITAGGAALPNGGITLSGN